MSVQLDGKDVGGDVDVGAGERIGAVLRGAWRPRSHTSASSGLSLPGNICGQDFFGNKHPCCLDQHILGNEAQGEEAECCVATVKRYVTWRSSCACLAVGGCDWFGFGGTALA